MSYLFARVDLAQAHYQPTVDWQYLRQPNIEQLNGIYRDYCRYKRFASVMPIFPCRYTDPNTDVIGYSHEGQLVAFSIIRIYDQHNALCDQFAWNYHAPRLRLGIETLKTECAIYRDRGFRYLYLDQAHHYKQEIEGFEILGPMN